MAPPACCRSSVSPRCGFGMPLAMCTRPSTPNSSAAQPMTCRPAGPLLSGLRRLRQATKHSSSGTNQPSRPTEPLTTVRVESPTPPGSCHQTAAATTTASPIRNRPAPSRRCSGSSSRAVCPTLRTPAPEHVGDAEPQPRRGPGRGRGRAWRWGRCRCGPPAGAGRLAVERPSSRGLTAGLAAGRPGRGSRPPSSRPWSRTRGGRGWLLVPRRRWGRRTGRHAGNLHRSSHQSHASHAGGRPAVRPRPERLGSGRRDRSRDRVRDTRAEAAYVMGRPDGTDSHGDSPVRRRDVIVAGLAPQ